MFYDYAGEMEKVDDFHYELGEVVYVKGLYYSRPIIIDGNVAGWEGGYDPSWRAKIIDRWYDDESLQITPWWFEVEPIDEPPEHRKKSKCIIVHEREIQRYP